MFAVKADSVRLNAAALFWIASATATVAAAWWWRRRGATVGDMIETAAIGKVGHIGNVQRVATFVQLGELHDQMSVTLAHCEFAWIGIDMACP